MYIRLKENEELCAICAYGDKGLNSCQKKGYWRSFSVGKIKSCYVFSFILNNIWIKKKMVNKKKQQ